MKWLVGDVIEQTNLLEPGSVDLVLTSPPFLALRSYLPADHPDKKLEGGSQATPGEYIDWLIDVVEALDRVLAPHGSLVVELGDTYAGSGGAGGDYQQGGWREGQPETLGPNGRASMVDKAAGGHHLGGSGWPAAKSLTLIPELFRLTLVYGFNPLTGRQTKPWRLRNVVRWVRPNPPVGALGDKFRPATSELAVLCRTDKAGQNRFFDLDAVRVPSSLPGDYGHGSMNNHALDDAQGRSQIKRVGGGVANPAGAPPLDWINQPPGGYTGAHYAVWPPQLLPVFIKSMTPSRVCTTCGEPARRIVGEPEYVNSRSGKPVTTLHWRTGTPIPGAGRQINSAGLGDRAATRIAPTVGFSDCGHNTWRPGHILDPFAGSGTTLAVATGHGYDATGIDLDQRNKDLAYDRIGPLIFQQEETV